MLVFPVEPNEITDINVNLSSLEVEVYNEDGTEVLYNEDLFLYCQGTDIAGNIIPSAECEQTEVLWISDYPTGVAGFAVGPGTLYLNRIVVATTRHLWLATLLLAQKRQNEFPFLFLLTGEPKTWLAIFLQWIWRRKDILFCESAIRTARIHLTQ